jgi:hypothetical protein
MSRHAAPRYADRHTNTIETLTGAIDPMPTLPLVAAIDAYDGADPIAYGRLQNLRAAAGDFLRVAAELPDDLPPDLRATVAGVISRL